MEEERKEVGKRFKFEGFKDEDKISELPDDLILRIFSTMSTEHIIRTGVLSKRWKNLWKQAPNLKFNREHNHHRFNSDVLSTINTRGNSPVSSLKMSVKDECDCQDLEIWTSIANARKVPKLVLILKNVLDPPIFPASVLGVPNRLKILKLVGNLRFNLPEPCVSLRGLKELHLHHARFKDAESLSHLLAGCPNLEVLVINLYIDSGVDIFCIAIPSLQRLTLGTYACEEESLVIEAPCLKYLNFITLDGVSFCIICDIEEIDEVKIKEHDEDMNEDILGSITSVRVLLVCSPLKYPAGRIFHRLTYLELFTEGWNWCQLLCCFLDNSPNIQTLKLVGGFFARTSRTWTEPVSVPSCFLNRLNTLYWTKYVWDGDDDKDVATYILKYAAHLKDAAFISSAPDNPVILARRSLSMNHLASVQTASKHCNVRFINRGFDEYYETTDKDSELDDFLE